VYNHPHPHANQMEGFTDLSSTYLCTCEREPSSSFSSFFFDSSGETSGQTCLIFCVFLCNTVFYILNKTLTHYDIIYRLHSPRSRLKNTSTNNICNISFVTCHSTSHYIQFKSPVRKMIPKNELICLQDLWSFFIFELEHGRQEEDTQNEKKCVGVCISLVCNISLDCCKEERER